MQDCDTGRPNSGDHRPVVGGSRRNPALPCRMQLPPVSLFHVRSPQALRERSTVSNLSRRGRAPCRVPRHPQGGLWKSIRAYATRRSLLDALDERFAREAAFLAAEERRDIVRAGIFLPPEAHSRLLSSILGIDPEPTAISVEGERGDPLIVLARRIFAG